MSDERFWAKVDASGECWEWIGHRDPAGYGRLSRRGRSASPLLAHRYSWELAHGRPAPSDMHVCHRCDNPPCVNPAHLFLGTARENSDDKWAKGRATAPPRLTGIAHPCATLPDAVIREVRESYAQGRETQAEIAARIGVGQSLVSRWVRGSVRPEAGGPLATPRRRRTRAETQARAS